MGFDANFGFWFCRQKFGFFPNFLVQNFKLRFVLCTLNPCEPMGTLHQKILPRPKIFTPTQNFHQNPKFSFRAKIFTQTQNFCPKIMAVYGGVLNIFFSLFEFGAKNTEKIGIFGGKFKLRFGLVWDLTSMQKQH